MLTLSSRPVGSSRILLLDLVHTFAVRPPSTRRGDYAKVIKETETYRLSLLHRIQAEEFFVIMLTARSRRYEAVTLENIKRHTGGWQPDVAIFNVLELDPPTFKNVMLHQQIFPEFGSQRSKYLALESNFRTRRMYKEEGITVSTFESYLGSDDQLTMNW